MKKNGFTIAIVTALAVFFCGCDALDPEPPPYVVSKPVCCIEANEGYYRFAGIEFDFLNTSPKNVCRFTVACMVYDADTNEDPFIGSNTVQFTYEGDIPKNESRSLSISLDPYIYVAPEKPFLIDFFHVTRIEYVDGSSWEDETGIYYTRSY